MIQAQPSRIALAAAASSTLVLVVEDEEAIRRLVQGTLEGAGYQVLTAPSAEHAITMLERVNPSLILLDIMLPGMDGFAFLDAYRARKNGVNVAPVILASALRPPEELPQGVVGYLRKPFDLGDLVTRVEHAIAAY